MHTAIVGAGPTGLYTAIALARRGHEVTAIDRDPGPGPGGDGSWNRRGVMQFHHPHGFRQQVVDALAEMPEVWDGLITAGAVPSTLPDQPERVVGLRCRRLIFERVLRSAAEAEPGVTLRTVGRVGMLHLINVESLSNRAARHPWARIDPRENSDKHPYRCSRRPSDSDKHPCRCPSQVVSGRSGGCR